MRLPANVVIVFALILAIILPIVLIFVVRNKDLKRSIPGVSRSFSITPAPNPAVQHPQREISSDGFNSGGYIVALESNEKGSIYSSKAQIKGVVKKWNSDSVLVNVANTEKSIKISAAMYLYCVPLYFSDSSGNKVLSSTVWMNFPKDKPLGMITESGVIQKKIPNSKEIVLLVNVRENDVFSAYMVAGFGCTP